MIVGVVPTGTGIVEAHSFLQAASVSAGVQKYVDRYNPPLDPADFIGFDTGWTGGVVANTPGFQWAYDRTNSTMLEIELEIPEKYADSTSFVVSGTVTAYLPRASSVIGPVLISYTNATAELTIDREVTSETINGVAAPLTDLSSGLYVCIPSSTSNWEVYGSNIVNSMAPDFSMMVLDSGGGQSFTGSVTVQMDTEQNPHPEMFEFDASAGTVKVKRAGKYGVSFWSSLQANSNQKVTSATWLEKNGAEVPGTSAFGFHWKHGGSSGEATASGTAVLDLAQDDVLRVRSKRQGSSGSLKSVPGGSRLVVRRIS